MHGRRKTQFGIEEIEIVEENANPETATLEEGKQEESYQGWLERCKKGKMANVVRDLDKILGNLGADQRTNINSTLLYDGKPISTYADDDWSGTSGIIFKPDSSLFLGHFPNDIGSDSFCGFNADGSITPQVMSKLESWKRSGDYGRPYAMKKTMYSALTKIEEIVLRRANGDRDHSSTPYLDIEGNYIYTGQKSKFSNKRADFTNHGRKVPKGRLRHNETHIRCNLSDIDGVFITKSDWERNSALAIDSLDNLIKSINQKKFHHNIKQQRRSELAIQDVEEIQDNILAKINYYQEEIKFLEGKKDQYQKDLEALNRGEIIKNEDLKIAFSRKKRKYNKFDENNNENKEIWLQKHIKSFEQDARELNIAIVHLKNENQEEKIRENLKKELKVYVYDANKGLCQEVSQQEVAQKIQRFKFLSLSKLAERQKKSIARNARYVGRSKIGILSFAASAVSSGLAYSDLRESIDNLHEKIGLTSYPISAIISLSIPILVSDSISGLVWEANNAIKTKSISKSVKLLGVGAAAYFSQRDLAPAIEKNGFSEVNSNIMAANCAIIGASLSSLIIDRAAKPIKRLCKGVIETIKQIRYQRNKVDPDTLQEANADLVFFNQTEQLPPPNHQIQQLLPPSQISVSSLQNVLPSQQQPPSLQR